MIRRTQAWLALLAMPISASALEVDVFNLITPRQENGATVRAGAYATATGVFPFTVAAGFTISCPFSSGLTIEEHRSIDAPWGNWAYVYAPDSTASQTWQMPGYQTLQQCDTCTFVIKGIAAPGTSLGISGYGASISFGSGELQVVHTTTFQMCKQSAGC